MKPLALTFVFASPGDLPALSEGSRRMYEYLIEELGRRAGAPVSIVRGPLADLAPPEGFVLLDGADTTTSLLSCEPKRRPYIASRLIVFGEEWRRLSRVVETHSLAAGIYGQAIPESNSEELDGTGGFYGHYDIAMLAGARCWRAPCPTRRYCFLHSAKHDSFAHLLVDYLRTLLKARAQGLAPQPYRQTISTSEPELGMVRVDLVEKNSPWRLDRDNPGDVQTLWFSRDNLLWVVEALSPRLADDALPTIEGEGRGNDEFRVTTKLGLYCEAEWQPRFLLANKRSGSHAASYKLEMLPHAAQELVWQLAERLAREPAEP